MKTIQLIAPRLNVEFTSNGQQCRAWLYIPPRISHGQAPAPAVIMAPRFGHTKAMGLAAYAERFAAVGYACLVFDYRHFGESDAQPRNFVDIDKQLEDWASAIAYARTLKAIDHDKIILWGTPLSNSHVMHIAGSNARISAVIVQIAQWPFSDALTAQLMTNPVSTLRMATRFSLDGLKYALGRRIARPKCPTLICIQRNGPAAGFDALLAYLSNIERREIKCYDINRDDNSGLDIHLDSGFDQIVSDQIDFLQRHVST